MVATLREIRGRIRSASSIKKITKAQELIAGSRVTKVRNKSLSALSYFNKIENMITEASKCTTLEHPLVTKNLKIKRSGILIISSDRGLCGGYNVNVLRQAEELIFLLQKQNKNPVLYTVGRKAFDFYSSKNQKIFNYWTKFSEKPRLDNAKNIACTIVKSFSDNKFNNKTHTKLNANLGINELHIVFTKFKSMLSQKVISQKVVPLVYRSINSNKTNTHPVYLFEPEAEYLFTTLLSYYITSSVYIALLEAAASESASRCSAMKSATDNAEKLIRELTLKANRERQAQITQEISEIVSGSNALANINDSYLE